jgi:uncharacterized protein
MLGGIITHVVQIIENISYKGGNVERKFSSIVRCGSGRGSFRCHRTIGIARAFNYGGLK